MLEEVNLELQASHQDVTQSTSSMNSDPTQVTELGNNDNQNIVEQELRQSNEELRNSDHRSTFVHFARQNTSRSSIRSESGIGHRMHHSHNGEHREEASGQFHRQQSTRMSTRSEAGVRVKRQNTMTEDSDYCSSIHQVHTHNQQEDSEIFITGLQLNLSSPFGDVPSFKDPELMGDGNLDVNNIGMLGLPLPPDIYSSQILNTVASPQGFLEDADVIHTHNDSDLSEPPACFITETNRSTRSLDRIISIQPHTYKPNGKVIHTQ